MGWLADLLGHNRPSGNVPDAATCPHDNLTPRWPNGEAMEQGAAAMGYVCHRCHAEFLPPQVPGRAAQHAAPAETSRPDVSDESP